MELIRKILKPRKMVMHKPYADEGLNRIYNLLFCDRPDLFAVNGKATAYPWNIVLAQNPPRAELGRVMDDKSTEARARVLAGRQLIEEGWERTQKELQGVIIEVGLDAGLDVLAAYDDGSARYINHSGRMVAWETETAMSESLISNLFDKSMVVVNKIGPWNKERLSPPRKGEVRLSFLVSGNLCFGQGSFNTLADDPMAGPVLHAATQLMIFLAEQNKG
jgi:hypothetical protein